MAWPRPIGFLFLVIAATLTLRGQSTAMDGSRKNSLALPGCSDKCGDITIPYPFGFGQGCFRDDGFQVFCDAHVPVPYLAPHKELKVMEIDLSQGEVRVQKHIQRRCKDEEYKEPGKFWLRDDNRFAVSCSKNKFTAIGCGIVAMIFGENQYEYTSACGSFCSQDSIDNSTQCTGMGCCQISIPCKLHSLTFSILNFTNYSADTSFSTCSYAFVAQADWFNFSTSYITSTDFRTQYDTNDGGVPMVIDWAVANGNCVEAEKMNSLYSCQASNSECVNATNGLGYRCICSPGYDGNPYLEDGCQDINECDSPSTTCYGKCINTPGSYNCSCPNGTQSEDPKRSNCTAVPPSPNAHPPPNLPTLKFVIGICISIIVLIICIFALVIECQKRKLVKEKERFFKKNGGQILYQQILSQQVDTVTIFTIEELKIATNNFDKSRELGTGGHGTVYKGILGNSKLVAVKRSKVMNVSQTEEFVQEMVILSQINHKNVVRLLGCCLEVEVPILVYEFIPNGTLFHLIHDSDGRPPMSLEARLKIAQESAEALSYLHRCTNNPIVHADVKSLNILLDENYMAKVTDFGASRMLPKDAVQFMTMVQGTLGYLDPEYLQEQQLTEKSDVYSFGVVLLELITRKTAIYSDSHDRGKCLASSFIQAMKENRVEAMLDASIMCAGMEELLREVTVLGAQCLSMKGEERPSMTQVADKLKTIRGTWRELLLFRHKLMVEEPNVSSFGILLPSM